MKLVKSKIHIIRFESFNWNVFIWEELVLYAPCEKENKRM